MRMLKQKDEEFIQPMEGGGGESTQGEGTTGMKP